jgi:hypothetical protein
MADDREPAGGTPAPLSPEQVDALVRGLGDEAEIAAALEAHSPSREERSERTRKRGPVRIAARDVAELAGGTTPEPVARRLEEAETRDSAPLEPAAPEKERPTERPPAASRRRRS